MDFLPDLGSRWFCAAAHTIGTSSFEMQICGDSSNRYVIGLTTIFCAAVMAIVLAWRVGERRSR